MDGSITSFDGKLIPASSSEMKSKFSEAKYVAENGVAMMFRYFVPPRRGTSEGALDYLSTWCWTKWR